MAKRAWKYYEPKFVADKTCPLNPVWPWGGHRAFAYDLVRWMRPACIAELGVHWGTSFFTFAQAIKDGRMGKHTTLVGVDTFEGEEHAGHYGPEVFDTVNTIIANSFPRLDITLHRMYFREALTHVKNETVDLLHIDGLHTYEAVKDDFESWLPKMAAEGIVLFHDVQPDKEYGSAEYWQELRETYPGFSFSHSWGLGVLFPKGESRLKELTRMGLDDKLLLYSYKADAMRKAIEVRDLTKMANDRIEGLNKQAQLITDLKQHQESASRLAQERLEALKEQGRYITQRDEIIAQQTDQLEKLRESLAAQRELLSTTQAQLAAAAAARDELDKRVLDIQSHLAAQNDALTQSSHKLTALGQERQELDGRVHSLDKRLAQSLETNRALESQLQIAAKTQTALENKLHEMVEHLSALATSQERNTHIVNTNREALDRIGTAITQALDENKTRTTQLVERIKELGTDSELLSVRAEYLEELVGSHRATLEALKSQANMYKEDWLTGASD